MSGPKDCTDRYRLISRTKSKIAWNANVDATSDDKMVYILKNRF